MPQVPMICNNCGHIFPSNIWIESGAQVSIDGYSEYCPKCRSMVQASNGLYKEISNLITFLQTENTTVEDLRKIERIFEKAQKNN
jgi:thiol-disulfide isomerase/thioredoxin